MIDQAFIQNLGVITIAAALFALAARALRLPSIVAYLVAGLALSPNLGLAQYIPILNFDSGFRLGELSPTLDLISEAGIVLLLFLVGLELSLEKIRGVGRMVLVVGLWQVGLTFLGAGLIARALGFSVAESVMLGIALTFSSTVVAVKLLEEKNEFNSLHGRVAVGVLLLQDVVVILILTVLSGFEAGQALAWQDVGLGLAKSLGGMAILMLVVLLAARYLLPRAFAWGSRSPETLFIWSLCWCFFIVTGAHLLHLSAESGAFLAGLSLAQLPYNHELRRRVHPLMNFFIAVFFVTLGLQMDPAAVAPQWPAALALTLFVLLGKFVILMVTMARTGFAQRTAHATSVTLSQISEFSFIFMAAAVRSGLVQPDVVALVGMVGLVTISVSSCFIISQESLYRAMERLGLLRPFRAAGTDQEPITPRHRSGHIILVGMNTLGRMLAHRLHERGEQVLALDTDPLKLAGLPCETMLGNAEYLSLLEEADLSRAKLLVSALRIEPTNDILAYRCHTHNIPCAIHVVDLSVVDNLLNMDVDYMMIPKVDGIKLQTHELQERGYLKG